MSEKVHTDNAAKQQAYQAALQSGFTESELDDAMRFLHLELEQAAQAGNERAARLLGETPLETLRNVQADIAPPQGKD